MPKNINSKLSNSFEIWSVSQQQCCQDTYQILKQYNYFNIQSHSFEIYEIFQQDVHLLINSGPALF